MAIYWLMFGMTAALALTPVQATRGARLMALCLVGGLFVLVIGLRHEVGGDWPRYLMFDNFAASHSLLTTLRARSDPGYTLVDWISAQIGTGIYGTNLVCGTIFILGSVALSWRQPLPWVSLAVATPYSIVVVAMGYSRQSAALGMLLLALMALHDGKTRRFLILMVIAATFHKSAFIFSLFALLRKGSGRPMGIIVMAMLTLAFGLALLAEQYQAYWETYVESASQSSGGAVRILMIAVSGSIMLLFWKSWSRRFDNEEVWKYFALLSILCVPLVFAYSTAVDRMALYLSPLQSVVWARVPVLIRTPVLRALTVLIVLGAYAAVLIVWLSQSAYVKYWVPYDNVLLR